jgi:hypothetical protein
MYLQRSYDVSKITLVFMVVFKKNTVLSKIAKMTGVTLRSTWITRSKSLSGVEPVLLSGRLFYKYRYIICIGFPGLSQKHTVRYGLYKKLPGRHLCERDVLCAFPDKDNN